MIAHLRCYGGLNDFLAPLRRYRSFPLPIAPRNTIKDVIEGCGVPHPEIALLLQNGEVVGFDAVVQPRDQISAYPPFRSLPIVSPLPDQPPGQPRFVLDVHLGRLASYLRLLGFDSIYRNDFQDRELAAQVEADPARILLTRDVGLLKRNAVRYGYYLRETAPRQQLLEVADRYRLQSLVRPFSLCMDCNGELASVDGAAVIDLIPPRTREHFQDFRQCVKCRKVYWKGSHYDRLDGFLRNHFPVERLSQY